jgi:phosphatidylinositol-3,4,5-trisphosphate 3-phosphatase and dual-specificity protein phosphatase PTEN
MNYIRSIVSGKKKRHQENGYDLDLSYITPRLIAMSIPGEGITKLYRNSLDIVSEFLKSKHEYHYLIFNLSGIVYDYEKFEDQVKEFPWEDHFPPPIDLLFRACKEIEAWLAKDILNIVAVNCKAGKGRTGTLICCYMIFCGRFSDADSALAYYRSKRFKEGGGVTQPSQVRYIKYFTEILHGKVKSPLVVWPRLVQLRTSPHIKKNSCRPVFEVYYNDHIVYSNKQNERDKQVYLQDSWEDNRLHAIAFIEPSIYLQGDILCRLIHWGGFKFTNICRFSFNTAFIPYNKVLILRKYEIDPYKFRKSTNTSDNFTILIEFEQLCNCKSDMAIEERCETCLNMINIDEKNKWNEIAEVLKNRINSNSSEILFGFNADDDVESVLRSLEETFEDDFRASLVI